MTRDMTYAEFEQLLSVYGSERARWPVEARVRAARLVARSPEAERLLQETEALDRVLAQAPLPALAREAELAGRIVMAAQRSPRVVTVQPREAAAVRVACPSADEEMEGPAVATPGGRRGWVLERVRPVVAHHSVGVGAALSAAALMMGVLLGMSNLPQPVLRPVQQLTGLPVASSTTTTATDLADEDYL